MSDDPLDAVDKGVIYALQQNARDATTLAVGEQLDVSASTIRNRIERLEA
ncbi:MULTISPECIES: AsnC family transcriptional regulator [unclassified Haladaptatus]|nr:MULTISPECIES: AsnC family transcriptional regulator [unclassified Haladaptatus]